VRLAELAQAPQQSIVAVVAVGAGFFTVTTLVLPWFVVAGRARSSIDLISSAGALDVIDGGVRILVIGLWLVVPVLAAIALILFAARRVRASMILTLTVSLAVLVVLVLGLIVDMVGLAWGAWVAAACSIIAMGCAMMALVSTRSST